MAKASPQGIWNKISLNALFTQRAGDILSSEIPNVLNIQWTFGNGPIARLNILSLEYSDPENLLSTVKLGKLMQAQDFTVNPIQCYFSNFGLCGWAQGTPYMVQIPGNPFNSYGAVVKLGKESETRLKYGVYQLAPDTFAPQYHGLNFRFDQAIGTSHFLELEIPVHTDRLLPVVTNSSLSSASPSTSELGNALYESALPPASITIGGWMSNGKFEKIENGDSQPEYGRQNHGIYGIASLKLPIPGLGMDNRFFLSSGLGLSPSVQQFISGGSAGLVVAGLFSKRPFDTLSLGLAYATYNQNYYLPGANSSSFTPGTEVALELNYNIAINGSVSIMPNYQYIINSAGNGSSAGVSAAGIQIWLNF
ncbi:MAG: carbohydrate porin [Prochlorococcaceae cyanobacterium]|jgi:carbohydrate-selective porin OprB